jgi:hypothetical protein
MRTSVPELVGVILAAAIIWKADWIAEKLQKIVATDKGGLDTADKDNF